MGEAVLKGEQREERLLRLANIITSKNNIVKTGEEKELASLLKSKVVSREEKARIRRMICVLCDKIARIPSPGGGQLFNWT